MQALTRIADAIDCLNDWIGRALTWAVPLVVLLAASVVVLRYGIGTGFPWLSESFVWLNGIIFTLGASHLLLKDHHVRVDVFYAQFSDRAKAVVNAAGVILLLWPAMYAIATMALPSVLRSIAALEASPTIDGLPFMYVLKVCVPGFCVLVSLQGLSMVIRGLATVAGDAAPAGRPGA